MVHVIISGTEDEKVDFYIQCGAVHNALHILKDSEENKDKQYQCTLIMSQIAVQQKERKNFDQIEERLNTITQDCSNLVTVSKAHLLIGQLMHKEQHIRNAFELLENERHLGMFIQVECIDLMITKYSLSNDDVLQKITQNLETFLKLGHGSGIKRFLKPDSLFGQERFYAMCVFYDFYHHRKNLYKLYPRQFPLGLKMVEEKQKCQQFEIYFDKTTLEAHCKKYLKTKFQCWKNKLIDAFVEKRKHFKRSNNIDMMTHFSILSIKAAICLSNLLFCDVKKQCEKFVSDLYCTLFLGTCVVRHCENVSAFLQNNDYKFIRSRIKENIVENLEKICSRNERGIAKFIRYFLMANLLDFKDFLAEQLRECCKSDRVLLISFEKCFDFLVQMEVKKAVCEFDHFCYLISKENSIPFPCDLFMLFCEMFLTIAFYIIARSYGKTCWFVVPQNYLDSLRHVENLFLQKNAVLKKISHDNKSKPESVFCLIHLIHIVFGSSCKLNLLNNKSNKQTEDRILALGFTVLCNLGGILTTADCSDVESNLAREVYQHLKRKRQEKIRQAMSEANFLIDFHKPLQELLKLGEHKLLWCTWDTELGLTHATEDNVHQFKGIQIKYDTRVAITNAEIMLDAENEENHVCRKNSELFNEEYPVLKTDDRKMGSSKKSSKRKRRRKLDTIHVPEQSGENASLEKDKTTTPRTEYCVNDSNEANSPQLSIEGTNDQHQTLNDNGGTTTTNLYAENMAFDNGAEQNKLFYSGQPPEILDRNPFENKNITDRNDDDFHDAKRLPDFDNNVEATSTVYIAGNMAFENISNQKELNGDQIEENRQLNDSFDHTNLTNDNNDGFSDDNLLTESISIMASRESNIEDLKREFTHEKCSQASTCKFHCTYNLLTKSTEAEETNQQMNNIDLNDRKFDNLYPQNDDKIEDNHYKKNSNINPETVLPETNKTMHANDTGDCDQHTQWEVDHDAPLNDIRYLFEVQNMDFMDDQDAPLAFIKYLFEDLTNEDIVQVETT